MPGVVPKTSTVALNNQTLRYGLEIASGISVDKYSEPLKLGVNVMGGDLICEGVAKSHGLPFSMI
jgi:alanine dehydrogenase